jgi:hypothetical protein
MGIGSDPVVAPDVTVDGIEGLRVVDASVISTIVSDNTNIAAIMIAEKGADPIRGARRAQRTQKPGPPRGTGLISRCFPMSASGAPSGPFPERAVPSAAPTSAAAARRCGNDQASEAEGVEPRRRRRLRESLSRQGSDRALLNVLEEVVGADTEVPGVHGQAVFATHGTVVLDGELPRPPEHDSARSSPLPHAIPLVTQQVDERARRAHADAVVVGGDEWACNALIRRLPHTLRDKVVRVGGRTPTDTGRALLEQQLDGVFRGRMAAHDRELVDIFIGRRALAGPMTEGLAATVAALQRGQVAALLLNRPPGSSLQLWAGSQPTQLALAEAELMSFGVRAPREERADEALVRALVGTGAELVGVPESELRLYEGVGALLRYTDPGTPS